MVQQPPSAKVGVAQPSAPSGTAMNMATSAARTRLKVLRGICLTPANRADVRRRHSGTLRRRTDGRKPLALQAGENRWPDRRRDRTIRSVEFKVRRIDAGEWPRLRAIRLAALTTDADSFGTTYERTHETPDTKWQQLAADGAQSPTMAMFVAVTPDSGLIAMAGASVNAENPDETHVWGVYVVPERRGRATGAALAVMDAARDWVRDHTTCSHITIHVTGTNDHALAFYRRYGFVETGESEPFVLDPTRTLLLMRYDIPR